MNKYLTIFESHSHYVEPEVKPNVSYCIQEDEVHYNPKTLVDEYFTIESIGNNNIISLYASNASIAKTVSVSTNNGRTWTEYTSSTDGSGTILAVLNEGNRLLVKGENSTYASSTSDYNQFKSSGQFEVRGNIMSLINGDSFINTDRLTVDYVFANLFQQCTRLTSAENLILPAITLSWHCYENMFNGCINLTTVPVLPATTLRESCYKNMFKGCTNLTIAPELPATTLATSCYWGMFSGCTSLIIAPELPAETLEMQCYYEMFKGCTSLVTAPILPAARLRYLCYCNMFLDCTSLNYIKCLATNISTSDGSTIGWVNGVASSGTFVKAPSMTSWTNGGSGIPIGWTVVDATE